MIHTKEPVFLKNNFKHIQEFNYKSNMCKYEFKKMYKCYVGDYRQRFIY